MKRLAVLLCVLVTFAACSQTDAGITTAVKSRLAADDSVKAYEIDVDTANGAVTLSGNVASRGEKEAAVAIARATRGVTSVTDKIMVAPDLTPTAKAGELMDDARGTAGRAANEAREAGREAGEALKEGARDLGDAGRDAASAAREAGRDAGAAIGDAAITTAVKAKFLADNDVSGLKIDVDTKDGVVTLNGRVKSRAEHDKAMTMARDTDGVKRVVDNMKIGG